MIAVICLKTLLNIIIIIIITIYYSLRKIQLCFFLFDMTLPHSNIVYVVYYAAAAETCIRKKRQMTRLQLALGGVVLSLSSTDFVKIRFASHGRW